MNEFKIEFLFHVYKDKQFRVCSDLRILFMQRYNLSYQDTNELILRIINYQVGRYGIQLHTFNRLL